MKRSTVYLSTSLFAISVIVLSCSTAAKQGSLRETMRSAYGDTTKLFNYAWSPEAFNDPANEATIERALDQLIAKFHKVDSVSDAYSNEPGFKVALSTHEAALADVRKRFHLGQKEYANWKLRAITSNCIACHSRYEVRTDFIGDTPLPAGSNFAAKLAAAEFLFATRQFDRAELELFRLAESMGQLPSGSADAVEALELWLVIEVRVKDRPGHAADRLETLLSEGGVSTELFRSRVAEWIQDLRALAAGGQKTFSYARDLLQAVVGNTTFEEDERSLAKTLYATSILHSRLQTETDHAVRRESTYLLALGYAHLPISSLEYFQELYLEQCIREYPGTEEAQKSFELFKQIVEFRNSGSSGLHFESEDLQELEALRALAYSNSK